MLYLLEYEAATLLLSKINSDVYVGTPSGPNLVARKLYCSKKKTPIRKYKILIPHSNNTLCIQCTVYSNSKLKRMVKIVSMSLNSAQVQVEVYFVPNVE